MSIITALQMRWHIITEPDLSERLPANSGNNARSLARTRPFSASHLSARVTHRRPHDKVTAGSRPLPHARTHARHSDSDAAHWCKVITQRRPTPMDSSYYDELEHLDIRGNISAPSGRVMRHPLDSQFGPVLSRSLVD